MNSRICKQHRELCQRASHNHSSCLNTAGLIAIGISEGEKKKKQLALPTIFSLVSPTLVFLANLFTTYTYLFFNYSGVNSVIPALKFTTGGWTMYFPKSCGIFCQPCVLSHQSSKTLLGCKLNELLCSFKNKCTQMTHKSLLPSQPSLASLKILLCIFYSYKCIWFNKRQKS